MKLADVAAFIKSNNAGAAYLTFDIGFLDERTFEAAVNSRAINADSVAALYPYAEGNVQVFVFPPARVIKITIPRPTPSGGADERDFDGVQQYAPLLELTLPL